MRNVGKLEPLIAALIILVCPTASLSAAANAQGIIQLSGIVVDTSGAVIAGATVQVRSANGTVQMTTQTDANGSFIISGLSAGNYPLVVTRFGFGNKKKPRHK